jgi:hypothetical protein
MKIILKINKEISVFSSTKSKNNKIGGVVRRHKQCIHVSKCQNDKKRRKKFTNVIEKSI